MSNITIDDGRPKIEDYHNAECWEHLNNEDLNHCFDELQGLANHCVYSDFNFTKVKQVIEFFDYPYEPYWDIRNLLSYIGYRSDLIKFELDCLDGSEEIK